MFESLKRALLPPVLVLGGLVAGYGSYVNGQHAKALAEHGQVAEAHVDRVTWKEKRISGREKGFKIQVRFETADKRTVESTLSVPKEMGQQFRDTDIDTVKVKYLPEAPQTVELADAPDDDSALMMGLSALAVVGGVGLFVYRRKQAKAAAAA